MTQPDLYDAPRAITTIQRMQEAWARVKAINEELHERLTQVLSDKQTETIPISEGTKAT
jgi:hypothetical protein